MSSDLDRPCPHEVWLAKVEVDRITEEEGGPVVGMASSVRAWCAACSVPLVFRCSDAGVRSDRPTISVDGTEIRLPGRPQTEPETFGLQLPGFGINASALPTADALARVEADRGEVLDLLRDLLLDSGSCTSPSSCSCSSARAFRELFDRGVISANGSREFAEIIGGRS